MAYAILETGGKQYKVEENAQLDIERIPDVEGESIQLDKVLLYSDGDKVLVGKPYLDGASIQAEVVGEVKDKKVISFKYIRREGNSQTKIGHRQKKLRIRVKSIQV